MAVVRLARGAVAGLESADLNWGEVLRQSIRERCVSLTWLQSAATIRAAAPASTAERWRAHALGIGETAAAQADELAGLVAALEAGGVAVTVLKGQPLSVVLYNDPAARPVFDIDLFVPVDARARARDILLAAGWEHLDGEPPGEGTFRQRAAARMPHLEVHSSLFDDALLAHMRGPAPEAAPVVVNGHRIPAHTGEFLPVFLAVHLAKHGAVPLLWWIDFATLWTRLDSNARVAARELAARYGIARFVDWAERGVALLDTVTNGGEADALRALSALDAMHHRRNALRVAGLVDGLRARWNVAFGWLVPPRIRHSPRALILASARRIGRHFAGTGPPAADRPSPGHGPGPARAIVAAPAEVASIVRDAVAARGTAWIRVRGTSMLPTIPRIADVLVEAVPEGGLVSGDVVLVDRPGGRLLMHRVVTSRDGVVHLKGDNRFERDLPVLADGVIGVATRVRADGSVRTIGRHPARSLRFTAARWRTLVSRQLRRARA